jgi:hypothetical protein
VSIRPSRITGVRQWGEGREDSLGSTETRAHLRGCHAHIAGSTVLDALRDIQRLRNRSANDGYEIAGEDGLTAVRRLLDALVWFTSTGSVVLTGDVPRLTRLVAKKAEPTATSDLE